MPWSMPRRPWHSIGHLRGLDIAGCMFALSSLDQAPTLALVVCSFVRMLGIPVRVYSSAGEL